MSSAERRLIAEQGKLDALRQRIEQTSYMKAGDVRKHLNISRSKLAEIPREVLPYVPGQGVREHRTYHPADVAAYPARARRWRDAIAAGTESDVLEQMEIEIRERDDAMIRDALESYAA